MNQDIPLLIYFDHNIWVELHKNQVVMDEDSRNSHINSVYLLLLKKIEEKKIIVVSNVTNFKECQQRSDVEARKSIIKFVYSTCQGYFHSPNLKFQDLEIHNFCCDWLGIPNYKRHFFNECIGTDFENYLGNFQIVPKDKSDIKLVQKGILIKELTRSKLNSELLSLLMKRYSPKDIEFREKNIQDHIKIRDSLVNIDSFKKRVEKQIVNEFIRLCQLIIKKCKDIGQKINIKQPKEKFPTTKTYNQRISFMEKFPYFFTLSHLIAHRNANLLRTIKDNDLFDIFNLSVPIAYFDVVIGEKSFITLAKQIKLDTRFNTILLTKFTEIEEILKKL